jgi:transposase
MGRGQAKIPTEIEEKIYQLYDENVKIKDIANELNIGLSTAQRYTARYKKELEEAEEMLNGALGEGKESKQSNKVEELEKIIQEQEEQIKTIENTVIAEKTNYIEKLLDEQEKLEKEIWNQEEQIKTIENTADEFSKQVDELKKENEMLKKDNIDWQNIIRIKNETIANLDKEIGDFKELYYTQIDTTNDLKLTSLKLIKVREKYIKLKEFAIELLKEDD